MVRRRERRSRRGVAAPARTLLLLAAPCAALGSCSGGGGGGSAPPLSLSLASPTVEVTEDGDTTTFEVALRTTLGPLTEKVEVFVRDGQTGTATSGVDYVPFAPVRLTFPAGATDGTTRTFELQVLDDGAAEADETVRLELDPPTGGAALVGGNVLTVRIVDDEPKTGAFALLSDGGGAVFDQDALVTLPATPLGGSSAPLRIRVENLGTDGFVWRPPVLTGAAGDFQVELVEVDGVPLPEPLPVPGTALAAAPATAAFPFLRTSADLTAPGALVPETEALRALLGSPRLRLVGVPWPARGAAPERELELELTALPAPFAPGARVLVDGAPLALDEVDAACGVFTGHAVGHPLSKVFLGLSPHGTRGWIQLAPLGPRLHLVAEPLAGPGAAPLRLFFEDHLPEGLRRFDLPRCGAALRVPPGTSSAPVPSAAPAPPVAAMPPGTFTPGRVRLVLETDREFHDLFGTVPATTTYVTQLVASVSELFQRHVQTELVVEQLAVYPLGDPWTPTIEDDAIAMLEALRAAYAPSLGGSWPVQAELVHMLSGDQLGGGVAYVDVLGNQDFGFGVSGDLTGSIAWGTFTGAPDPLIWDYSVFAHEIGHGFGSAHTHEYCPPIDRCFEGCVTTIACSTSSLMSYCHLCPMGLMNVEPRFHALTANEMRRLVPTNLPAPAVGSGTELVFEVRFEPYAASGTRDATLRFTHGAANLPSPFRLRLRGEAQ